jgi:ankyrin repeat protein
LQQAVLAKKENIVQLLLKANANPNASREDCGTALQIAAFISNESIVKKLLEAKADVKIHCKVKWVYGEVWDS